MRQAWLCRNPLVPQQGRWCWGSVEGNGRTHPGCQWRWDFFCLVEGAGREAWLRRVVVFDMPASSDCKSAMSRRIDLEVGPVGRVPQPSVSSWLGEDECILSGLQGYLWIPGMDGIPARDSYLKGKVTTSTIFMWDQQTLKSSRPVLS